MPVRLLLRERILQFFGFLAPAVEVVVTGRHDSTDQRVQGSSLSVIVRAIRSIVSALHSSRKGVRAQPACLLLSSLQAELRLDRRRVKEKPLFNAVRYVVGSGVLDPPKALAQFLDESLHSALKLVRIGSQSLFSS